MNYNVYIVTYQDEYENIRAEQVEAYDCASACYGANCETKDVISVMRIYKGE